MAGWLVDLGLTAFETVFQSISGRLPERGRRKQDMLQYVTNAPEGPLCATHLLIMLYLSVKLR